MGNGYPHSTIAQILEDIISQLSFEGESHSNIADILLSILNQTSYDKEPYSVLAELFLKLKAKIEGVPFDPYDKETHSVIADILVSILNETEYTDVPQSRIAELLLELKEELESYTEITVSGSIVSFKTNVSKPLVKLKADVEAQQDLHGYDKPWAGGGGKNKMPDVFTPLPATNTQLVDYGTDISFTGLYMSFVLSGQVGYTGGVFIQGFDSDGVRQHSFTFNNLVDHNGNPIQQNTQYTNELVYLTFSSTKSVKRWLFFRNWQPSDDATIKNFMLSIGNTATSYAPYENICPITGWSGANVTRTGKNLFNGTLENGSFNTVTGEKILSTTRVRSVNDITLPSGSYVLNNLNGWQFVLYVYDLEGNFKSSESYISWKNNPLSFSLVANRKINFAIRNDTNTTIVPSDVVGLTLYDSTLGNTYTIAFGDTYYGCELDVTNGVLRVKTKFLEFDYQSDWRFEKLTAQGGNFYVACGNDVKAGQTANNSILLCNSSPISPTLAAARNTCFISNAKNFNFTWGDSLSISSASGFKDYLQNNNKVIQVNAELATPIEIPLTPIEIDALAGDNVIFADTGDIEVTYLYKGTPET